MSPRYSSVESDSGFYILLSAHDHIWKDRTIPLIQRLDACNLFWALIVEVNSRKKQLAIPPKEA